MKQHILYSFSIDAKDIGRVKSQSLCGKWDVNGWNRKLIKSHMLNKQITCEVCKKIFFKKRG